MFITKKKYNKLVEELECTKATSRAYTDLHDSEMEVLEAMFKDGKSASTVTLAEFLDARSDKMRERMIERFREIL